MKGDVNLIRETMTVGEVVTQNYHTAKIFNKFGVDFCCKGNLSIKESCAQNDVDIELLLGELNKVKKDDKIQEQNFDEWPLDKLIDYIENVHHDYVKKSVPLIKNYMQNVLKEHGDDMPNLQEIAIHFDTLTDEMKLHMEKEEILLFPYIKEILRLSEKEKELSLSDGVGLLEYPVKIILAEHESADNEFKEISALADAYNVPPGACTTHKVCCAMLKAFEDDLRVHIHLESNILFPKAIALDEKLSRNQ